MGERYVNMLKKLTYTGFLLIFALTAAEILTRMFFQEPISRYIASDNQRLVYELNPEFEGINSSGMRQGEIDRIELENKFIIAFIGDSHTYSVEVEEIGQTIPSRLQHHLEEIFGPDRVRVLNFGVPGYNLAQELEVFEAKALTFEPNLIILQYTINDTHVSNYLQPKNKFLNSLIHKSVFFVLLWKVLLYSSFGQKHFLDSVGREFPDLLLYQTGLVGTQKAREKDPDRRKHPPRNPDRVPARYHYMLGWENWKLNLHEFGQIGKEKDISMLATGFIEDENRRSYTKEGFQIYSFYDIFYGKKMKKYGYKPEKTHDHFDVKGSDYIAKELADFIFNNFEVE